MRRWHLQMKKARTNKAGDYYCELLMLGRADGKRPSVSLGYLPDDRIAAIRQGLEDLPPALFEASKHQIRTYVLDDAGELVEEYFREERELRSARRLEEARERADAGHYDGMTLKEYYTAVWTPHRRLESPSTWEREDKSRWPRILEHLGHVRLQDLNSRRWTGFRDAMRLRWKAPNTHRIAQNEYKQLLVHAVQEGAIESVHPMPKTSRARVRDPIPLSRDEYQAIIEAATSGLHKALFAMAFGQGLRAGEPGYQRWEHVDWQGRMIRPAGTKTDLAGTRVPLAPITEHYLSAWWEECGRPASGWCFPWRKGKGYDPVAGQPIQNFKTALKTAAKRVGGEELKARVYPNLARHTFATVAVLEGDVPEPLMKGMMRHKTRSTILNDAYVIRRERQMREAADRHLPAFTPEGEDTDPE